MIIAVIDNYLHLTKGAWTRGGWKNYQTTLRDRFRYEANTFWGTQEKEEEGSPVVGVFNYINSGVFERSNRQQVVPTAPFRVMSIGDPVDDNRDEVQESFLKDFYKKQPIWIKARPEFFSSLVDGFASFNPTFWRIWVEGGSTGDAFRDVSTLNHRSFAALFDTATTFVDHTFRLSAPLLPKELKKLNGLPKPAVATTDMEYNFYIKEYESMLSRIGTMGLERFLPNMYVFLVEEKSQNLDEHQSIFWKLITLNGGIDAVSKDVMRGTGNNAVKIGEEDTGQYFDKWARKFEAKVLVKLRGRDQTILDWSPRYKRIILSPLDIELFKGFNEKRFLFPMYVDIEFSTDRRTLLADAIKESQLGTSLMKAVMEPVQQGANDEKYRPRWSWFKIATETITGTGASDKIVEVSVPQRKVVLDIVDWWTAFKNRATSNTRKSVVLGTSLPEIFVSDDQQYRFVQTILSLIFSGKIRETLRGRLRTFEDIMNGKHAYSETIFYKISKHHRNFITNLPEISSIQDFYVPNSSELDLFKFVDTQVAFGKKYVYIVSAYEMVFGTAYQYRQPSADARNAFGVWNDAALIDVYTRPSIQLIETPILMFDPHYQKRPLESRRWCTGLNTLRLPDQPRQHKGRPLRRPPPVRSPGHC